MPPRSTSVPWPRGCSTGTRWWEVRQLGSWDYLGGLLVCTEAGAVVGESQGRDLVTLDHAARRTPVAASTPALLESLSAAVAK